MKRFQTLTIVSVFAFIFALVISTTAPRADYRAETFRKLEDIRTEKKKTILSLLRTEQSQNLALRVKALLRG